MSYLFNLALHEQEGGQPWEQLFIAINFCR